MAQLKDLIVNGPSRFIGDAFANNFETFRVTNHLIPITTNTYDLGTEDLRWNHIYANSIFGEADSAKRLSNGHNFNVSDFDKTNVGGVVSFNGTQNVELLLPENIKFKNILATQNITVNTGNIDIVNVVETDKYLGFYYNASKTAGASWRIGHIGSGSGETNYFVIQSGTSATTSTTWNDVIRLEMNSFNALFKGSVIPQVTNTKTLGTSNLKWKELYSGKAYIGDSATYGSGIKPIYWNDGVPTPSTSSIGSATKPIYLDGGTITVGTYELKSTVNEGTTPRIAWYSGNNAVSAAGNINYLNAVSVTSGNTAGNQTGLKIWGQTYGDATYLKSNTNGVIRYGDPGVQIQFGNSTPNQNGALIFTDYDSAGSGVSWHFVSDQSSDNNGGAATVTAPRFRARAGLTIGQNTDNTTYKLYVNGTSYHTSNVYFGNGTTYQVTDTGDAKFRYLATGPDASINTNYPLNVKGNSYLNGTAEVTGAFTGDSTGLFKNILTLYRESTTSQNYPAGIQFKNKDTTTGKEDSQGYIYAYNSHGTGDQFGLNMRIQANSSLFIGAGEGVSNVHTALFGTAVHSDEILFLIADGKINIEANANSDTNNGSTADRVGFQVDTAGHIIPVKAEANNTNVQNLGSSNSRWAKLYIGGQDTYGATNKPIWWDQGAPKAIAYSIDSSIASGTQNALVKYTGANAIGVATNVGDATHPIYIASTGIPTQTTVTNNTSATAYVNNADALVTMKTLYYGSASINNARQTSSVSVYAPTSGGDAGKFLIAQGATSTPTWQSPKVEGVALKGNGNIIYIGVCSTAAGTVAKTVTLTGEQTFELVNGARVFVKFDNINTAANPTLSVNNTTAKNIKVHGTIAPNSICTWQSGEVVEFVYDGTNWERVGGSTDPKWRILYAVCNTAAGTAAKTVTFDNFTLETGTHIYVKFTYNNTAANPTLNVNSTGAKPLWINGAVAGDSEIESWKAGAVLDFVYDGTNWVAVSENKGYTPATGGTADQFLISGGENAAPTWKNPKVEGVTLKSNDQTLHYGICTTATGTVAKVATLNGSQTFTLVNGARVIIKFDHANTATNPTLNVNETGAKPIYRYGTTYAGAKAATSWKDNSVVEFVYDGNAWMIAASGGGSIDINNNNTKKSYLVGYDDDLYYYDSNVYLDTTSGMMYSKYNKTDYLRVHSDDTGTSKNAIINGNVDIGTGESIFTGSGTQTTLTNSNEATPFTAANDTYTFTYDTTNSVWVNNNPTNTSTYAKKTWTAKNNYILTFTFNHHAYSSDQFTVYLNGNSKYYYASTTTTATGTLTLKVKTGDIVLVQFYRGTNTSTSYTHTCKFTIKYESATVSDTFTFMKDQTTFSNENNATSYQTGAVRISGGVGIAKDVYIHGKLINEEDISLFGNKFYNETIFSANSSTPTDITDSNMSTYFSDIVNGTYTWNYDTTDNLWVNNNSSNTRTTAEKTFTCLNNCILSFSGTLNKYNAYFYIYKNGVEEYYNGGNYSSNINWSKTLNCKVGDVIKWSFQRGTSTSSSYQHKVRIKIEYQAATLVDSIVSTPVFRITNSTNASSTTTGALQVTGGLGVQGTGYFGAINVPSGEIIGNWLKGDYLRINSDDTNTTNRAIIVGNTQIGTGDPIYTKTGTEYTIDSSNVDTYFTKTEGTRTWRAPNSNYIVTSIQPQDPTIITDSNASSYFTVSADVNTSYPLQYDSTGQYWYFANTYNHHSISNEKTFTALSNFKLRLDWSVYSESVNYDWLQIFLDGVQQLKVGGAASSGILNLDITTGQVLKIYFRKDTSSNPTGEYYRVKMTRYTTLTNIDTTYTVGNYWQNDNNIDSYKNTTSQIDLKAKNNCIVTLTIDLSQTGNTFSVLLDNESKYSYSSNTTNSGTITQIFNVPQNSTLRLKYQRGSGNQTTTYLQEAHVAIKYSAASVSNTVTTMKDQTIFTREDNATSYQTGAVRISGGVGITKDVYVHGKLVNEGDISLFGNKFYNETIFSANSSTKTNITDSNISTYFNNIIDGTYTWNYNTTDDLWINNNNSNTRTTAEKTFTCLNNCILSFSGTLNKYSSAHFYIYKNGVQEYSNTSSYSSNTNWSAILNCEAGDVIKWSFERGTSTSSSYQHKVRIKMEYQAASLVDSIINTPIFRITNSTNASSTTSGALQVTGGIGVQGNSYFESIFSNWLKGNYLRINSDDTNTAYKVVATGNIMLGTGDSIFTPNGTVITLTSSNETTPFTATNGTYAFDFDSTNNTWNSNNVSSASTTATKTWTAKSNYILVFTYNYSSYYGYFRIYKNGTVMHSYRASNANYNGTYTLNVKTNDIIKVEYQRESSTTTGYSYQVKVGVTYQAASVTDTQTTMKDVTLFTRTDSATTASAGAVRISGGLGVMENIIWNGYAKGRHVLMTSTPADPVVGEIWIQ